TSGTSHFNTGLIITVPTVLGTFARGIYLLGYSAGDPGSTVATVTAEAGAFYGEVRGDESLLTSLTARNEMSCASLVYRSRNSVVVDVNGPALPPRAALSPGFFAV